MWLCARQARSEELVCPRDRWEGRVIIKCMRLQVYMRVYIGPRQEPNRNKRGMGSKNKTRDSLCRRPMPQAMRADSHRHATNPTPKHRTMRNAPLQHLTPALPKLCSQQGIVTPNHHSLTTLRPSDTHARSVTRHQKVSKQHKHTTSQPAQPLSLIHI